MSFRSNVIVRTHRHTHRTDCFNWTTKVVGDILRDVKEYVVVVAAAAAAAVVSI